MTICPACRKTATYRDWQDDIGGAMTTIETLTECKSCGYQWHYSYGDTSVTVGNQHWNWNYSTDGEVSERYKREIEAAIRQAKGESKMTIHEYPFQIANDVTIWTFAGMRPLTVIKRGDTVRLRIFREGHAIDEEEAYSLEYIATVMDGPFVWHFFMEA